MGVSAGVIRPEAYDFQEFVHARPQVLSGRQFVNFEGFGEHPAHGHPGVEGAVGVLEDDLHLPPDGPEFPPAQGEHVRAVEKDFAIGGLNQAEDGSACRGFAAAGFPHQAEGLSLPNGKGDAVHRLDVSHGSGEDAPVDGEIFFQVLHVQKQAFHRAFYGD